MERRERKCFTKASISFKVSLEIVITVCFTFFKLVHLLNDHLRTLHLIEAFGGVVEQSLSVQKTEAELLKDYLNYMSSTLAINL